MFNVHNTKQPMLIVHHKTDGNGNYVKCKPVARRIVRWYRDGKVQDHCGEVWYMVKDVAKYITVG